VGAGDGGLGFFRRGAVQAAIASPTIGERAVRPLSAKALSGTPRRRTRASASVRIVASKAAAVAT
jgi:hypothetical protein